MANTHFLEPFFILHSVPKGGIWRDVKFVRFPDAIYKLLIFQDHSRYPQSGKIMDSVKNSKI